MELSEIAVDIIETVLDDCADTFRSRDIPCSYRGSRSQSGSALPVKPFSVFPAASSSPEPMRGGKPAALEQDSLSVLREAFELSNEALCECAISELANGVVYEDVSIQLTEKFTHLEIVYAALSLLADFRTSTSVPVVVQALFAVIIHSGFPCAVIDYGYTPEDCAEKAVYHTAKMIRLTEEQCACMRLAAPKNEDERASSELAAYESLNLAQFIYSTVGVIPPPTLTLSLREARVLESYGLSRLEAVALCGYMDALRSMRLTVDYMADISEARQRMLERLGEDGEDAEEKSREEIRQEIEKELSGEITAVKKLRESTESDRRKLMREHRTMAYRAEKAEQRTEDLQKDVEALREMVAALTSERDGLKSALLSVSGHEADDEPDETIDVRFPCDIGKDIRVAVFGGNQKWVAEQRRRFPHIDFYENILPNTSVVANADILLVNAFAITHSYFAIIQDAAKKNRIPIRYFDSKGINRGSHQIIEACEGYLSAGNDE